ncbi:hypothetical protein ACUXQW_001468 [Staphylococcus saprophyticus]
MKNKLNNLSREVEGLACGYFGNMIMRVPIPVASFMLEDKNKCTKFTLSSIGKSFLFE